MAFFSTNSSDYVSKINSLVKPTYTSKYDDTIAGIMDKIANREEFSYDFNADPLYQNYKDQYTKLGNEAAMNAAAAVSNQTGGFGNSYASTAASQANQQYLTQLNDKIPELYNAAMNKYQMETENLYNQFGMYEQEEGRQYGQYRDEVSDYYSDWSNLLNGYGIATAQENSDRDFNYRVGRDAVADAQWQKQFDYNASRDAVSDSQWQKQFDESKRQWQTEYDLALQKAMQKASGGGSKSGGGGGGNTTTSGNDEGRRETLSVSHSQNYYTKAKKSSDPQGYIYRLYKNGEITLGDYQYLDEMIDKNVKFQR